NAAYYRMAKSMELQPRIIGLVVTSGFHSPATFQVTPHLQWLNRVFEENGGIVVDIGPDSADSGALVRSRARPEQFEKGELKQRKAMAIWPRKEMLRWAAEHPEFGAIDHADNHEDREEETQPMTVAQPIANQATA